MTKYLDIIVFVLISEYLILFIVVSIVLYKRRASSPRPQALGGSELLKSASVLKEYLKGKLTEAKDRINISPGSAAKTAYTIERDLINALISSISRQQAAPGKETLYDKKLWEGVLGSFNDTIQKLAPDATIPVNLDASQPVNLEETINIAAGNIEIESNEVLSLDSSDVVTSSNLADILKSEEESGTETGADAAKGDIAAQKNIEALKKEVIVLMGYGDTVKGVIKKLHTIKELNDRIYEQNKYRAEKSQNLKAIITDYNMSNQELEVYIGVLENAFTELQAKVKNLKLNRPQTKTG
ncbi:MAG: hypothetical protein HQL01_09205 [Nitrospirae bacterium]|nr:hypothetical protein [Nitrospirota bacterium]